MAYSFLIMALTLFGRPLPALKRVDFGLASLFGLGRTRSQEICRTLGFPPALLIKDLTSSQEASLARLLKDAYVVAGNLEEELKLDRQRLLTNGCQRGYRLRTGLPVRGQRTHSNGKTARRLRGRRGLLLVKSPYLFVRVRFNFEGRWLSGRKHRS
jgi:small subunit ribosomal protein S13